MLITKTLRGRYYDYSHFRPKETKWLVKSLIGKNCGAETSAPSPLPSSSKAHIPNHYCILFENVAILSSNPFTSSLTLDKPLPVLEYPPGHSFSWSSLSSISTWKNYTLLSTCSFLSKWSWSTRISPSLSVPPCSTTLTAPLPSWALPTTGLICPKYSPWLSLYHFEFWMFMSLLLYTSISQPFSYNFCHIHAPSMCYLLNLFLWFDSFCFC